jgi:hypothetical protein
MSNNTVSFNDGVRSTSDLEKEDRNDKIFKDKGIYLISLIIVTLAIAVAVIIYFGFLYNTVYNTEKIDSETDLENSGVSKEVAGEKTNLQSTNLKNILKDKFRTSGIVLAILFLGGSILSSLSLSYWRSTAEKELLRQNIFTRDLSDAMRAGQALDKVSGLLSYHVHPDDASSRTKLSKNLQNSLKNSQLGDLATISRSQRQAYYGIGQR